LSRRARKAPTSVLPLDVQARPKRALSQSFLTQASIAEAMVQAADVAASDNVLEIGPGRGALTRPLVRAAGSVVAIELDNALAAGLPTALDFPENLKVVRGDALADDLAAHVSEPYLVVASLPYHVASPILFKLLTQRPRPERIVAMVQEEVALRIVGRPGAMTYLGMAVATLGEARLVRRVSPGSFFPVPKVRSAVIRIDVAQSPTVDVDSVAGFLAFLRAGFAQPRKQLHNSLAQGLGLSGEHIQRATEAAGIDSRRRPGDLRLEEWAELYRRLSDVEPRASTFT
jgi:16S rRNA (adenine1518-N6/adenine1519-N6)-dimethyltransferase